MRDQAQTKFVAEIYDAVVVPADPLPTQFAIPVGIRAKTVGEDPAANAVPRLQDRDLPSRFLQQVPRCQSRPPRPDHYAVFFFHHPSRRRPICGA